MEIIKVVQLFKNYAQKTIHKNISFKVMEGECLGLLGGSGVGKSVLLRCLIGLEKSDGGSILIEGQNITHYSEAELFSVRKKVAYVFQNGALFDSLNVFENLAYPLREHTNLNEEQVSEKVHDLLDDFNLEGAERLLPSQLSGGMQKRVGLARAIILDPKVILYDEPTAGLDPANTLKIQDLILKYKAKKVTSVLVTHDLETALRVCDRISFLENGSIEDLGNVDALEKDKSIILNRFIRGLNE